MGRKIIGPNILIVKKKILLPIAYKISLFSKLSKETMHFKGINAYF